MQHSYISENPDLLQDWDWELNDNRGLKPDKVTVKSRKRIAWKCHVCGFEGDAVIVERTRGNCKCPMCKGKVS